MQPTARLIEDVLTARDGARLAVDVHLPPGEGPWPAVLMRTPYGRMFQREDAARAAALGLAVVVGDVRGRFGSAGGFDLGSHDAADGVDTVAWLRAQPWCDGRVAGRGTSYPGITQWRTALGRPEGLVAIAPMMCPPWWSHLGFREGGAVQLALAAHWLPLQAAWDESVPDEVRERCVSGALQFEDVLTGDVVDVDKALRHPALGRLPLGDPGAMAGAGVWEDIWRRLFSPPGTVSWLIGPGPDAADRIDAHTLVAGSWYDVGWSRGQTQAFDHLQRTSPAGHHRLVMSPHGHGFDPLRHYDPGPDSFRFHLDSDLRWAAEWLLDDGRALRDLDPVTYFTLVADEWRGARSWPPPGAEPVHLHLHPDGMRLDPAPAGGQEAGFVYDPARPVPTRGGAGLGLPPGPVDQSGLTGGARADVLSFDAAPVAEPWEITGPVTVELDAASDAPDTDFTAKLCDVAPDGRALSIVDGVLRARYRHGPEPVLLEPGEPGRFLIDLGCVSWELRPGHRLRLDVSSSNFPKYDRNPNSGAPEGTDTELRPARQRVLGSSRLEIHVKKG